MASRKILLVEGKDDQHVLEHLSEERGGPHFDQVVIHEGKERLLDAIPIHLKAAGDEAIIGIVIDADMDMNARWQSLRDRLRKLGYPAPNTPAVDGTIMDPPSGALLPRVGIWIMPDNQTQGILEDFLRFLVPANSRLFDHVQKSVANIPAGERRFSERDESKVLIHTSTV